MQLVMIGKSYASCTSDIATSGVYNVTVGFKYLHIGIPPPGMYGMHACNKNNKSGSYDLLHIISLFYSQNQMCALVI